MSRPATIHAKASLTLSVLISTVLLTAATPALQAGTVQQNKPVSSPEKSEAAPDYAREKRLDNQIRDAIFDGEAIDLNDGTEDFMAIQTDADEAKGAAIILHGRGFHPDWADVVNPLRVGLAEQGWTTLSIQMPVLEKQAKYYDYVPLFPNANLRITAALAHLKEQGISPVVLIAHSCGGHMAMDWVRNNGEEGIDAFIGLGMGATDYQQFMAEPFPLDKLTVPVFDVYGEKEYPAVIEMAPERLKLMQAGGNEKSEQAVLPGADHYFHDKGDELTKLVSDWLETL